MTTIFDPLMRRRLAHAAGLFVSGFAICFPLVAAADDTDASQAGSRVSEVVVTADRSVTATKTNTKLVDTPQSIDVVSAQQIADLGVTSLKDSLQYSTGLRADPYGSDVRGDYAFLRGVLPSVFQDGLNQAFSLTIASPTTEVFTLSRVEVLLGPSSMLYGQGSVGGLINSITKVPQSTPALDVEASYGSFGTGLARVDATGPLGDWVDGRFVGVWRDAGSQVDHVRERRSLANPSVTFNFDPNTSLTLIGLYQQDRQGLNVQFLPIVGTLQPAPNGPISFNKFFGEPNYDFNNITEEAITSLFKHKFADGLTLDADVRYTHQKIDYGYLYLDVFENINNPFVDPNNTEIGRVSFASKWVVNTVAADSRLQYDVDTGPVKHKLLLGIDYNYFTYTSLEGSSLEPAINVYAPVYGNYNVPTLFELPTQTQDELGEYLQDQMSFGRWVDLIVGARHDNATNATVGSPTQSNSVWTKHFGLVAHLPFNLSSYLSYSESFQPVAGELYNGTPFEPQRGEQWEGGVKWQPDIRTLATLAVYDLTLNHQLETDPVHLLYQIQSGSIRSKGVEVQASREVAHHFDVIASFSHDRAEISADTDPGLIGRQVASVPKNTASLWAVKYFDLPNEFSTKIGGGVRYVGTSYDLTNKIVTPDYSLLDLMAGVSKNPWYFQINVSNALNKRYLTTCLSYGNCYVGTQRTVLATIGYHF